MSKTYFLTMLFTLLFLPTSANANSKNSNKSEPDGLIKALNGSMVTSSGKTAYAFVVWNEDDYANKMGVASFNTTDLSAVNILYPSDYQAWAGAVVDGYLYCFLSKPDLISFSKIKLSDGTETMISGTTPGKATNCSDMAYDYTTNTMYFTAKKEFGSSSGGSIFGTINLTNGDITPIGNTPFILTLACNSSGQLFGLGEKKLYKINKTDATTTIVGIVNEEMSTYTQSMDFDRDTDELYWTGNSPGANGFFAKVNTTNAVSTRIGNFYKNSKFTCLYIPFTPVSSGAPAKVTELSLAAANAGALSATLSFHAPKLTYGGASLSTIHSIEIYRDDVLLKTYTAPAVGSAISYTDNVEKAGLYKYKIVANNSVGTGAAVNESVFIGKDVPAAPTSVVLTKSGSDAVINWVAPTIGLNTGWFDASQLKYKITRLPDQTVVATDITQTTFKDTSIPQLGNYSYQVQAIADAGSGGTASSNSLILGAAYLIPYSCSFLTEDDFTMWTVIDANADQTKWAYNSKEKAAKYDYSSNKANDWLISSPIAMQLGKKYKLRFDFRTHAEPETENLKVFYGKGATVEAQTMELLDINAYSNKNYTTHSATIIPTENGAYNIGFQAYSDADIYGMYIKNVSVEEMYDNDLAALVVNANTLPMMGKEHPYIITIKNEGILAQQAYRVELINGSSIVASTEVTETIAPGETKEITVWWKPTTEGEIDLKGKVILPNDQLTTNNETPVIKIQVQPAGDREWGMVGTGNLLNSTTPIEFYYETSASQTVYLSKEIGLFGTIEKIVYKYNNKSNQNLTQAIQVYMCYTKLTNLSTGWIPKEEMTLVFDGDITINKGEGESEVTLTTPFIYPTENLCVMVLREGDYFNDINFLSTSTNEPRTLTYGDDYDPFDGTQSGESQKVIANLNIYANTAGGKIQGVVQINNTKLEGVDVTLQPLGIHTTTDANGAYLFPYAPSGTYHLTAIKKGYEQKSTDEFTLSKNQTVELNLSMNELSRFTVSGTVKDYSDKPIVEAAIEVRGYENFTLTTDANGAFTIPNVYKSEYSIKVSKNGLASYTGTFSVTNKELVLSILLTEIPYSPSDAVATVSDSKINLTWGEPTDKVFRYDDGTVTGQLGFNGGVPNYVMGSVHKTPAGLNSMSWLTTSQGGPHKTVNVFVIDLDNEGYPTTTLLYSQMNVPNTDNTWSTFRFPTTIECPRGFMIAISYTGFMSIAHDAGNKSLDWPFIPKGNYYGDCLSGEYIECTNQNSFNFMIRANGYQIPASTPAAAPTPKVQTIATKGSLDAIAPVEIPCKPFQTESIATAYADQSVQAYKVWRLTEEQQANEATWTLLTPDAMTGTAYTDNTWTTISNGAYRYAVKAVYAGVLSTPTLSNMVSKGMTAKVTVNVTTNITSNLSDGAIVQLTNNDNNLRHVYTATVSNGKAVIENVWKGTYKVTVALTKFTPIEEKNIDLTAESHSLSYELKEVTVKPYSLEILETGKESERIFNWNVNQAIVEDFEGHPDFEINSPGEIGWSYIDGDGAITYGIGGYEDEIGYEIPMAYRILNPSATKTKPSMLERYEGLAPHSGDKTLAFFASIEIQNKDFFISPALLFATDFTFSFWAKAFDRTEKMRVGYSITGKEEADFAYWLTQGESVEVGFNKWTKYTYTVPYTAKYVTIECVSYEAFILLIDDVFIGTDAEPVQAATKYEVYLDGSKVGEATSNTYTFKNLTDGSHTAGVKAIYKSGATEMSTTEFNVTTGMTSVDAANRLKLYPSPVRNLLTIEGDYTSLEIIDASGKSMMKISANAVSPSQVDMSKLANGVYMIKACNNSQVSMYRIVKLAD